MKYLRLKKNTDFQKLFKRGKRVFSPYMTLLYFPSDKLYMGIAVSKKHGKAVLRNRIKRLLRASFSSALTELEKNYSIVVIPKVMDNYTFADFEKSFKKCFKKINACAN